MLKYYAFLSAFILKLLLIVPSFAQSLPELPPEGKSSLPPLTTDEMVPERTLPEKNVLGEDRNAVQKKQDDLNKQFYDLKRTANVEEAAKIDSRIQGLWAQSGSDTTDLLMQWAEDAIRDGDYIRAMDFLDNVVALQPDFAEGWMRRASVHAQINDLALAMFDLDHVLKLEPRHYNALMLMGLIMEATERNNLAIKAYGQALDIYPQMQRAQSRIGELLEQETDRAI